MSVPVLLRPGDEPELEAFLARHADTSMFLRGNLRGGGIVDGGKRLQGTYAAIRDGGVIIAVASSNWNGVVLVQGDARACGEVARAAVSASGRGVAGLSGPWTQVVAARVALGLDRMPAKLDSKERLYALSLAELRTVSMPPGRVCRRVEEHDVEELARWRYEYEVESLGAERTPEREAATVKGFRPAPSQWVLTVDDQCVATSAFNAELPDCVQIGGVFTPVALRGKGYARSVVAGSLLEARAAGVTRSILFTPQDNVAAQRAYEALGYEHIGEYGLVLFEV